MTFFTLTCSETSMPTRQINGKKKSRKFFKCSEFHIKISKLNCIFKLTFSSNTTMTSLVLSLAGKIRVMLLVEVVRSKMRDHYHTILIFEGISNVSIRKISILDFKSLTTSQK